jgi:hypothetical protein
MPRPPEYRAIHGAADKVEPRLVRALELYARRLAKKLPMRELLRAIELGDARLADELLTNVDFVEGLTPSTRILEDAFVKGGKVIVEEIP